MSYSRSDNGERHKAFTVCFSKVSVLLLLLASFFESFSAKFTQIFSAGGVFYRLGRGTVSQSSNYSFDNFEPQSFLPLKLASLPVLNHSPFIFSDVSSINSTSTLTYSSSLSSIRSVMWNVFSPDGAVIASCFIFGGSIRTPLFSIIYVTVELIIGCIWLHSIIPIMRVGHATPNNWWVHICLRYIPFDVAYYQVRPLVYHKMNIRSHFCNAQPSLDRDYFWTVQ